MKKRTHFFGFRCPAIAAGHVFLYRATRSPFGVTCPECKAHVEANHPFMRELRARGLPLRRLRRTRDLF